MLEWGAISPWRDQRKNIISLYKFQLREEKRKRKPKPKPKRTPLLQIKHQMTGANIFLFKSPVMYFFQNNVIYFHP